MREEEGGGGVKDRRAGLLRIESVKNARKKAIEAINHKVTRLLNFSLFRGC